MNARDLIEILETLVTINGNLEVGFRNEEFGCCDEIINVNLVKASRSGKRLVTDDSESLGDIFIEIS
jgi:hypothetical protein